MARLQAPKRIRNEDFSEEQREIIDKIAYVINIFNEDVFRAFNGNINFDNINQQIVNVVITTDSSGNLVNAPDIKTNLVGKPQGIICIKADNLNSPTTYATNQPFVNYTLINDSTIRILSITGIPISSQFNLRLLLIGN